MDRSSQPRPPLVALPVPVSRPEHHVRAALPAAPTALVGRVPEVAAVSALLRRPDVRLLTLTGAPGIGKTRLAVHVATEQAAAFRDGVIFLPLASIRDPRLIVPAIARAVGAREASGVPLIESLSATLHAQHLLLVLDNFEQVAEAASTVAELLAACPEVTALVTSRSVLHVRGEHEFVVPPLGVPDLARMPAIAALARCEAVALFLQCAHAIVPDFRLSPANARAVAEICVQLDGLPLAIELAVPRLRLFAPDVLRTRLERRLLWLTDGPHDLPIRQRALRSAIAWSDELLQPDERRLFRRLAIFVGGWTMEAAAICADETPEAQRQIEDGIASLLDKSLLRRTQQPDGEPRFGMLEMIREYGLEQLAVSGDEEAVRQRHAAYYTALAEEAEPHLYGEEQAIWLERMEREHANIRAALAWLLDRGETEMMLRLVGRLRNFWTVHDHLREGQRWTEAALAQRGNTPAWLREKALSAAASFALRQGDYPHARMLWEEDLALCRDLGDNRLIAQALLNLAQVARIEGDQTRAVLFLEESLALARAVSDQRTVARALNQLGEVARHDGDDARAAAYYDESVLLWRQLGENERIAMVLHNLGPVLHRQGEHRRAIALLSESLALSWELRNTHGVAICLYVIAGTIEDRAGAIQAARLLGAADALRASIGVQWEPVDQAEFDRGVTIVRAHLDDAAFTAAWAEGTAFTLAQAMETAQRLLLIPDRAPPARRTADNTIVPVGGLTRREYEVAVQIALGKTNREIGETLFIAEKTVEMHVSNSLSKLGFRSRTQLAAWAVSQGATHVMTTPDEAYP